MPKTVLTPTSQRVEVPTDMQTPGLQVTASPVSTVANTAGEQERQLNSLMRDFGEFTGAFDRYAQHNQQEIIQNEQEKALMDSIAHRGEKPVLDPTQSAWYQKTSMQLYGKQAAADATTALNEQIANLANDPEALRSLDPKAFMDSWVKQHASGIDDPDVAKEVYPVLQQMVPQKVDDLIRMKQHQLGADQKAAEKAAEDSAWNMGAAQLTPEKFDAENMWATFEALKLQVGEEKAAQIVIGQANNALKAGGMLNAPEVLLSKNPRNGYDLGRYLGNSKEARNSIGEMVSYAKEQKRQLQEESNKAALDAANQAYSDQVRQYKARVSVGGTLTPAQLNNLRPVDRDEIMADIVKNEAKKIEDTSHKETFTAHQTDTVDASNEKKQDWFDETYIRTPGRLNRDPMTGETLQRPVSQFDPQKPAPFVHWMQSITLAHTNGNKKRNLDLAKAYVDGVELEPMPRDLNGTLTPRVQAALAVSDAMDQAPSFGAYRDHVFSKETQEFLRIVKTRQGVAGSDLVSAADFAKNAMTPERRALRQRTVGSDKERAKVVGAAKNELDSNWVFSPFGAQQNGFIEASVDRFLETNGLDTTDPQQLGRMLAKDIQQNTVAVQDWTQRGFSGVTAVERRYYRPLWETALPQGKKALDDREYGEAVTGYAAFNGQALSKMLGGDASDYDLIPDPRNRNQLIVTRNGSQLDAVRPVPVSMVVSWYQANSRKPEWYEVGARYAVKSPQEARAEAERNVQALYPGKVPEAMSKAVTTPVIPAAQPPKAKVKTDLSGGLPPLTEVVPAPERTRAGKVSKATRWNDQQPGQAPAVPDLSKLPNAGLIGSGVPMAVPPELAAKLK